LTPDPKAACESLKSAVIDADRSNASATAQARWTEELFDRSFDINVKGPYFLLQALLPVFADPASVVLNTSTSATARRGLGRVAFGA
jgi:NAD(P)-dependent dehydrogenase (short-subunit alcohol dehydrogenase family)